MLVTTATSGGAGLRKHLRKRFESTVVTTELRFGMTKSNKSHTLHSKPPLMKSSDLEVCCFRTPNDQNGIKNNAMMALWTSQICHSVNQIFCAEAVGAAEKIAKYWRQKIYTNPTESDLTKDAGKNLYFAFANSIIRQKIAELIYSATAQLFQPPPPPPPPKKN